MYHKLLEYQGHLDSEVRTQLNDLVSYIGTAHLAPRRDIKALVGIALELLDNAYRHGTSSEVAFLWRVEGGTLTVIIQNKATKTNAERLQDVAAQIANMSSSSVLEALKRKLMEEGFGENGGAGLGMLQIAKRVGKSITAEIIPIQNDVYLCTSIVRTELGLTA